MSGQYSCYDLESAIGTMADNKFRPANFRHFKKVNASDHLLSLIMIDVSVCQTEGFQAVSRFLRPFCNLQIMTH
jgi:hypothetical protein